jgi:hypothetical protein
MAVHSVSGTLVANTANNNTLTSWEKFVVVTVTNGATAGRLSITTDGSTVSLGGADCTTVSIGANATVTVALKNRLPLPDLTTSTPLATDPSAAPTYATSQSKVNLISDQPLAFNISIVEDAGPNVLY